MANSCTSWKREQRPSGSSPFVRRCTNGDRAEIISGDGYFTANVYRGGKWATRVSASTLKKAKAAASRRMR